MYAFYLDEDYDPDVDEVLIQDDIKIICEKDLVKEIYADLKDNYEIPPKIARKLAKTYHKRNLAEVQAEHADFEENYEKLFETK